MKEMMKMIQGLQKAQSLDENTSTPIVTQPPPESAPKVNQNISTETGQHRETNLKWPTYGMPPNYNPLYEGSRKESPHQDEDPTHGLPLGNKTTCFSHTQAPPKDSTPNSHHSQGGFIAPIIGRVSESPGPWFNPNVTCAYHSGVIGHSIEHCRALKYKVHHLMDTKQLTFEDATPDVHRNPLPNHGNQGINAVEGAQGESYIWEVPEIKTPMKVIFQEMCKHGMVEKMVEDEDPNNCEWHGPAGHALEDCPEFKLLLQKMLNMRLITVERGPLCQSVNAITQGEGDTSQTRKPSMTRFLPVMNVPHNAPSHRWIPVMKVMKPVTKSRSQPFPYKSDKAVPWVYGGDSTEIVGEPLEVTNVAGVSKITRSGRVYGPLDARKVPANTSKGKAKVNILADEEVEADLEEPVVHGDKDWERAAEEKRKGRMARLGQFEYKAGGILIPHIGRSFISAGFASGTIAVVGEVVPETQTNYVIQCPPGTVLNNWTEEDVSPRVFYENM
ncbi:hypothetical protein Lal_00033987 [Lupinus albus]|nr:hypothetical protein Lal_00033987 [Lupinus albus]